MMTKEDKELLLKDLCARLPYGVKIKYLPDNRLDGIVLPYLHNGLTVLQKGNISYRANVKYIRPYLRPMSSMTDEEREKFRYGFGSDLYGNIKRIDWLNKNHFDYRELIPMGLALKAPKKCISNSIMMKFYLRPPQSGLV